MPGHDGRGCSKDPRVTGLVDARLAALGGQGQAPAPGGYPITPVAAVLADLHARAPRARIFVAAYPELFRGPPVGLQHRPLGPERVRLPGERDDRGVAGPHRRTVDQRADPGAERGAQDGGKQAERSDRSLEATFVGVKTFSGHGLCDDRTAWINPLVLAPGALPSVSPASFHPTVKGQRDGYAKAFRAAKL